MADQPDTISAFTSTTSAFYGKVVSKTSRRSLEPTFRSSFSLVQFETNFKS
jgi:hypothetical protein